MINTTRHEDNEMKKRKIKEISRFTPRRYGTGVLLQ